MCWSQPIWPTNLPVHTPTALFPPMSDSSRSPPTAPGLLSLKITVPSEEKVVENVPSQRPGVDASMALKTWFFLLACLLATKQHVHLGI